MTTACDEGLLCGCDACKEDVSPARMLALTMSDISEECWCAVWLHGTEYALWDIVVGAAPWLRRATARDGRQGYRWGQGVVTDADAAKLKQFSNACGGWVRWRDEGEPGPWAHFVPMAEWLALAEVTR